VTAAIFWLVGVAVYLVDELETNGDIPRTPSAQPLKMCDLSDLPKKPGAPLSTPDHKTERGQQSFSIQA